MPRGATVSHFSWRPPDLVFQQTLGRTRRLKLLEGPFENDRAEIAQAASFFGGVFFQLCPKSWTDPHADLDSPLAHCPLSFIASVAALHNETNISFRRGKGRVLP